MNRQAPPALRTVTLVLGALMIALGLFLALRPLMAPGRPVTNSRWLDMAFALFFLVRGAMNVRSARRARGPGAPPPAA
jgi:hypothetical protein